MTPSNQKAFTDSDLRRLKELGPGDSTFTIDKIEALLDRLEAAEKVCEMSEEDDGYYEVYKAWMRAAGKV